MALRETAADENGVIPAIDRLSKRLRERVGESLRSLNNTEPLEQVSTASLEALKKYSQAVRLDDNGGDPGLAAQLLKDAVAADSNFAMAWRKLSVVGRRAGLPLSQAMAASQKAYDLRDRLSPLEQQMAIANYFTSNAPDPDKAIAAYKAALEIDPNERTSLNNLALTYREQGRWEDAEAMARRAAVVDRSWFSYGHLAFALAAQGRYASADSALKVLDSLVPGQPRALQMQAQLRSAQGDYAGADSILRGILKARSEPAYQQMATGDRVNLALTQGRLAEAEGWADGARAAAAQRRDTSLVYAVTIGQAYIDYTERPKPKHGLSAVDSLLRAVPLDSLAPDDRPYGGLARLYAAAGQPEPARRYLALDQKTAPLDWATPQGQNRLTEGLVLESEGKLPEALEAYRDAGRLYGTMQCRQCADFYVGRVLDRMNQPDSALSAYDRAVNSPGLGRNSGEATVLAPTLRRMGELYEARGEREKAKEYYGRFVALWRDADSDLQPAVQDVRARLALLSAEPKQ